MGFERIINIIQYLIYPIIWILRQFSPTKLILENTQLEWNDDSLLYEYQFKVKKPRFSLSVSKSPIPLEIASDVGLAEFEIEIPAAQLKSIKKPLSHLFISAKEILEEHLSKVQDNQVIPISLRIPSVPQDVLDIYPETQLNQQVYRIKNPNPFKVGQCDIIFTLFAGKPIRDIQIIKKGNVERTKLIKIKEAFTMDFEAEKILDKFPEGIATEDNRWLSHRATEAACEIQIRLDFDSGEEIEVRLVY